MDDLVLAVSNGTRLVVPRSLDAITTYVLLEQETWFEKEFAFLPCLLSPGATAIDIGANLGIYSVAMAKLVGPSGRVFAYEPTSATRARLERSRAVNGAANLTVIGKALSDGVGTGRIVFGKSSELNHLGDDSEGDGEAVEVSTLDVEAETLGWGKPDFIKMDAEGAEEAIIRGGARVFAEGAPIVMLEIRAGSEVNLGLIAAMHAIGYEPYRSLSGAPLLVPVTEGGIDGFELNFFAIKGERADVLERRGLLVRHGIDATIGERDVSAALERLRAQPYARSFGPQFAEDVAVDPAYLRALGAYEIWLDGARPATERWAALGAAVRLLHRLSAAQPTVARASTLGRLAALAGRRSLVQPALSTIISAAQSRQLQLGEPFWPAAPRYDDLPVGDNPAAWLLAAASEQIELSSKFSTAFAAPGATTDGLARTPFASPEIRRRIILWNLRHGKPAPIPASLQNEGPLNLNAELWRDATVASLGRTPAA